MGFGWHPIYEMENQSHAWNHQPGICLCLCVYPLPTGICWNPSQIITDEEFSWPIMFLGFFMFFPYVSHIFPLSAGNCWGTRHQSKPWFDPTSIPPSSVNSIFSWQTKYGQVTISAGKTTICHHLSIVFPDVFPVQFPHDATSSRVFFFRFKRLRARSPRPHPRRPDVRTSRPQQGEVDLSRGS